MLFFVTDNVCNETVCVENGGLCREDSIDSAGNCTCLGVTGDSCNTLITNCSMSEPQNPCYNGTCIDFGNDYNCECTVGWDGQYCHKDLNFCTDLTCVNGICIEGLGAHVYCNCSEIYRGEICDEIFCPTDYCMNNGTCSITGSNVKCSCLPGYSGESCEIDQPVCDSETCLNGGTCHDGPGLSFTCECALGFGGITCTDDVCDPNPCINGTCIYDKETEFHCNCSEGYEGDNCELVMVDICTEFDPCSNGSTCIDLLGDEYMCNCARGYDGNNCTNDLEYCDTLNSSVCLNCTEGPSNSVYCSECPIICDCMIPSCHPSYCSDNEINEAEILTCDCLTENGSIDCMAEDIVNITCTCSPVQPLTTSLILPSVTTYDISTSTPVQPSTTSLRLSSVKTHDITTFTPVQPSTTLICLSSVPTPSDSDTFTPVQPSITQPHLTKCTNDTSQTEDLDVEIIVVILVPGCTIIACLLLIIVLLIIALVRMFKKRMIRIVPLSELSQT